MEILAINNDGEAGKAERMPIGAVPEVDKDEAESIFRAALNEARDAGTLDETLYAAFNGRAPNVEADAGDHRQSQPERESAGRDAVTQTPPTGGVSDSGPGQNGFESRLVCGTGWWSDPGQINLGAPLCGLSARLFVSCSDIRIFLLLVD